MEKGGVPSVTLVTKIFGALATTVSRGVGFDALRVHQLPHPLNPLSEEQVRKITREHLPAIVAELLQQPTKDPR
jgi:hypothetical protein